MCKFCVFLAECAFFPYQPCRKNSVSDSPIRCFFFARAPAHSHTHNVCVILCVHKNDYLLVMPKKAVNFPTS